MRVRWLIALSVLSLGGTACGSDSGSGPPGTGGEQYTEPEPDPEEEIAPEPGTCRKLCCSSADCGLDETCTALDSSMGTLGYCSGTGGSIPDGTATDINLPAGCWNGSTTPMCNPVTNAGCGAAAACDYYDGGDPNFEPSVACYGGESTQGPGAACDLASGPWCIPGFHCVAN